MKERRLLYKLKSGSHLYGLSTPQSDIDYTSVIMPLPEDILGLQKLEEIDNSTKSSADNRKNTNEDIDDKSYTLHRYINLLLNNNPNLLETLFANDVEFEDPIITELKSMYPHIISMKAQDSFLGFSFAQKAKLSVKRDRYFSIEKALSYIKEHFNENLNETVYMLSEEEYDYINKTLKYYKGAKHTIEHFHKGMSLKIILEKLQAEFDEYGWRTKTDTFKGLGYDVKYGYHAIRLLIEGEELLTTGKLTFPIKDPEKTLLLDIKNGKVSYDELINIYNSFEIKVRELKPIVPEKSNFKLLNDWLISKLLKEFKEYEM